MTYNSAGAKMLQSIAQAHPESVVWNAEKGWHDSHKWEVSVSNIGTVHTGTDEAQARETYKEYCESADADYGRASGETVTLWLDGEIEAEHDGENCEDYQDERQYPNRRAELHG